MTTDVPANALLMPQAPPQLISRVTGYVIWRSPYPGWDAQQLDAVTFMSVAGIFFGLAIAVKYRHKTNYLVTPSDNFRNMSVLMSTLVTYYLYATLATVFGFWMIDVGKVWVVLGVLHNAMEFCILTTMICAKNPAGFNYFYAALFVYWAATQALCIMMPWPMDAVYFKFQGLVLDFSLVINFYRLMCANSTSQIALTDDDEDQEVPPVPNVLVTHVKKTTYANAAGGSSSQSDPSAPKLSANNSIWILLLAASIHLSGNLVTVVSLSKYPFLLFQFCYGITFPLYGYYVARQPGASRMRWYQATKTSETLVTVVSIFLAGAFSAVGILVGLAYYGH